MQMKHYLTKYAFLQSEHWIKSRDKEIKFVFFDISFFYQF